MKLVTVVKKSKTFAGLVSLKDSYYNMVRTGLFNFVLERELIQINYTDQLNGISILKQVRSKRFPYDFITIKNGLTITFESNKYTEGLIGADFVNGKFTLFYNDGIFLTVNWIMPITGITEITIDDNLLATYKQYAGPYPDYILSELHAYK